MTAAEKRAIALHEAGHATVTVPHGQPLGKVSLTIG